MSLEHVSLFAALAVAASSAFAVDAISPLSSGPNPATLSNARDGLQFALKASHDLFNLDFEDDTGGAIATESFHSSGDMTHPTAVYRNGNSRGAIAKPTGGGFDTRHAEVFGHWNDYGEIQISAPNSTPFMGTTANPAYPGCLWTFSLDLGVAHVPTDSEYDVVINKVVNPITVLRTAPGVGGAPENLIVVTPAENGYVVGHGGGHVMAIPDVEVDVAYRLAFELDVESGTFRIRRGRAGGPLEYIPGIFPLMGDASSHGIGGFILNSKISTRGFGETIHRYDNIRLSAATVPTTIDDFLVADAATGDPSTATGATLAISGTVFGPGYARYILDVSVNPRPPADASDPRWTTGAFPATTTIPSPADGTTYTVSLWLLESDGAITAFSRRITFASSAPSISNLSIVGLGNPGSGATVHPVDAGDDFWETMAHPKDFDSGYPNQLWPCFAPFDGPSYTRALRLRATAVTPVNHPHVIGNTVDGKRVWLGEVLALCDLGDAPLALPVFEEPEMPHAPIPVTFTTPDDGYVTLVIEKEDGTRVRNLVSETWFPKGENTAWWNGSDDLLRDEDAQNHGLWHIPTNFVEPGTYRVRGLWHAAIEPVYEFSVYAPGNPPWNLNDHTGAWLSNHSAPQAATFVPGARSMNGAPVIFLGAYVTEGPDGFLWCDLDANKLGGMGTMGQTWTSAPFICHDAGPGADTDTMVYVAAIWHEDGKPVELRLNNVSRNGGSVRSGNIYIGPFVPFAGATEGPGVSFELSSIAAWNRNVYCSVPDTDRIVRVDASGSQGVIADSLQIERPRGMAFDSDGSLLVVSGTSVVRVVPAAGGAIAGASVAPVVSSGLEDPQQIAMASDGGFFVGDWGSSHQVKAFTRNGAFRFAIGHAGVPSVGSYDELHMNNPAGLAIDSRGQLWVAENNYVPKRVSVWNATNGSLVKAVYGPAKYGGGGMLATDNADRFVYADENRGTLEFEIDWETGESRLVNIPYRSVENDIIDRVDAGAPEHVFTTGGHRYYSDSYNSDPCNGWSSMLFLEVDGVAKPIAAVGSANWGTAVKGPEFASLWPPRGSWENHDPTQTVNAWFIWCDANGDFDIQPGEVEIRSGAFQGANILEDLTFAISCVDSTAYLLRPASVSRAGVPSYRMSDLETVATGVQPRRSTGGGQMLSDGAGTSVLTLGVDPFSPYSVTGVKDGRALWSIPNPWPGLHASHNCDLPSEPGQLIGVTRMLGGLFTPGGSSVGPLWGVNANMGNMYIMTLDGLFVTTLFKDIRTASTWSMPVAQRGISVGQFSLHDENFWPTLTCLPNGQTYIVDGAHSAICRINGLETLRPIDPFSIEVSQELIAESIAYEAECEAIRRAARGTGVMRASIRADAPAVDGNIAEWVSADWVEIYRAGMGANFNSTSKPYSFKGAVAVSGDRLYAAWDTTESQLLRNSGEMPNALFKTGGALDLMLGTDPNADPRRTSAVAGDRRLTVTRVNGETRALLYTAVVPGTPASAKVPFSSPWRTIYLDSVEDVSGSIQLADNGNGAYEMSVPLSVIGLAPVSGMTISADIGVLRGDGSSTTARTYWSNKATGITSDVPSEAEFQPGFWGRLVFE